jgi:hypothetical protein
MIVKTCRIDNEFDMYGSQSAKAGVNRLRPAAARSSAARSSAARGSAARGSAERVQHLLPGNLVALRTGFQLEHPDARLAQPGEAGGQGRVP